MIRNATITDAYSIAKVHIQAWQSAYQGIVPDAYLQELSIEKRAERWNGILSKSLEGTRVALQNDEVVGWVSFGPSRDEDGAKDGEIYAIYVQPAQWGCGVAQKLLIQAEEELLNFCRITLWVLQENKRAQRFYAKNGYTLDFLKKKVEIGGKTLPVLRYEKSSNQKTSPI